MSAEEFIAQNGFGPAFGGMGQQGQNGGNGCGCAGQSSGCPCCQPVICCCQPAPCPPQPEPVDEDACCCKQSFRAALQLLCDPVLAALLNFSTVAFVSDGYTAGAPLEAAAAPGTDPADNLDDTLAGTFRRFSPCACDMLDIVAPVYPVGETTTAVFNATQMPLCSLDAMAIQAIPGTEEGDLSDDEVAARNFRQIKAILSAGTVNSCALTGSGGGQDCGGESCCCSAGLLDTLSNGNLSRQVSLVAGPLVLTNVTLLGTVGNVLVLANDTDDRIYFVCVNSVQFIG